MSTLNAPPPPLPDQNANTVTTTSDCLLYTSDAADE